MTNGCLAVNAPEVLHETIDGETIVIHLGTGTYYSLDGVAAHVWALAEHGMSRIDILEQARRCYAEDGEVVATSVGGFIEKLIAEQLLIETAERPESSTPDVGEPGKLPRLAFAQPVLNIHQEMQDFLLADPLHDVDESAGWPHVKAS